MSARPRIRYYLVHQETGQRYPISDREVVIGRTSGDIVYQDDPRLSTQHCLIQALPSGLSVQDLGSAFGTAIDIHKLEPGKLHPFRNGSYLTAGQQIFKLEEVTSAKRTPARKRPKKKAKKSRFDLHGLLAVAIAIGGAIVLVQALQRTPLMNRGAPTPPPQPPPIDNRIEELDRETAVLLETYKELARIQQAQSVSDADLSMRLRINLIPGLIAARNRLSAMSPNSEWERRKIEAHQQLLAAILAQATANALFAENGDPNHLVEMEIWRERVENLSAELTRYQRQPAGR